MDSAGASIPFKERKMRVSRTRSGIDGADKSGPRSGSRSEGSSSSSG